MTRLEALHQINIKLDKELEPIRDKHYLMEGNYRIKKKWKVESNDW